MKYTKYFSAMTFVLTVLCLPALAQYDTYHTTRTLLMESPTVPVIVDGVNLYTNNPVDKIGYTGIGSITLICVTNGASGAAVTATIESSADQTNWTAISNFGLVSSATALVCTNMYYGATNWTATNNILLPYTLATPTPASAGFATAYPVWTPFTNTGAITVTASGAFLVGLNLDDCQRYLHVKWNMTGSATNHYTVTGALLNGFRSIGQ